MDFFLIAVYNPIFWLSVLVFYVFGMYEGARITRKNGHFRE